MRLGSDGVQCPKATVSMPNLQSPVASFNGGSQGLSIRESSVVEAVADALLPAEFSRMLPILVSRGDI